ncbi:YdcF family protein [Streptomyces sp. AC627_RSS907]|uniref:YdcF family protein n=1 Tax=Streptomyces sp. AC627_RSS907 TaxID=2823684 RepID=UPI0020B63B0F|nr:YdcF family protein [Streptomyces sp. AC627_RSS907]
MIYAIASATALLLLLGTLNDLRRFSNAVCLGLTVLLLAIGVIGDVLKATPHTATYWLMYSLVAASVAAVLLLTGYLLFNGMQMLRKEGRSLGNLLSLAAGLGILAAGLLLLVSINVQVRPLSIASGITFIVLCYFGFLFACYVGYGYLYGRMGVRKPLDYIVVLGSGLIGGNRVPPLLASRLDQGRAVWQRQNQIHGRAPVLITSGGQGPDEDLPESHAMAQYLIDKGVPSENIWREDNSRTTEQNLLYSKAMMDKATPGYRCLVVTNNYHAFRAALLARETGVPGQALGSPTARYFLPSATLREFTAVVWARKFVNGAACVLLAQQCWVVIW